LVDEQSFIVAQTNHRNWVRD